MLFTIAVVLLIVWGLGFAIRVVGGIIHIVLVLAVVLFVLHFATGRGSHLRGNHPIELLDHRH
jgi:hypothetical protein